MSEQRNQALLRVACAILLVLVLAASGDAASAAPDLTWARLAEVTVKHQPDATVVHVKTAGAARYRAELIDSPDRLVLDLEDTVYGWRKTPLVVDRAPVKAIRGSQYRRGVARLVLEFTRKVGYAIREDADGLSIVIPTAALPPQAAEASPAAPKVLAATVEPAVKPEDAGAAARPAGSEAMKVEPTAPPPGAILPAPRAMAARKEPVPAGPVRVAQTQAAPAAPANGRLISLDFKDADVVNLLRILAAESGRNIVIGDDVKGKMSISLRNVPWDLALDTILSVRGLERLERDGVMRIVSTEQLTKEREARARVEEAKIKGEAEARAKLAEAQVKEAEAIQRKLAAQAAQREAEARGPLREETVRLSYADPEEVAKTLQGILGIPAEGQKIQGPGYISGPIAEPPFSQLFGPGAPATPPAPPISVSQDVLAKGLTIRAHKPTNTLFLRLHAADLERVKTLIRESLDVPLPQVKIEARMEILDRTALEQIGIQWGGFVAGNAGSQTLVGQGLQTTTLGGQTVPFLPGFIAGNTNIVDPTPPVNINPVNPNLTLGPTGSGGMPVSFQTGLPLGGNLVNLPISALPNAGPLPAAGLAFGIIGTKFNVNLALQALASQGKTRTLARPEIVTVENSKAVMSLGEEIPYATISSAGTQIQFKEALLKLEVTPTVIREGDETKIKMVVIVENNSRGDVVNLGNAGAPPAINRRKAETQVLIREGDRLVIGGVTTSVNQNTVRKVPLLGDVPILGHLFKQREDFETGRELVVFLTPTVLRTPPPATAAATPAPIPGPPATPTPR
ncbi:MAG TPA: secretin N-terminal domain-containing protein [Candidatus Binatia bacterium]|nr:secretin N-terminal domain-containing protein [Candidatus Binatia bacterium]